MKRVALLAVVAVIIFQCCFVFAGCGKEKEIKTTQNKALDVQDLNGYTFTIATLWPTIAWPSAGTTVYAQEVVQKKYDRLGKDYNVKVEMKALDPYYAIDEIRTAVLSGDKYADYIQLDYERYQGLIRGNLLRPLDDIMDLSQEKYFPLNTEAATYNGKQYGFEFLAPVPTGIFCVYNRTLIEDKLKLPSVSELVLNKKWTWDKFQEYAAACIADTDGDGTSDQFGYGTIDWGANNFEKPMIWANGGRIAVKGKDGKYSCGLLDDSVIETLNFIRKINYELKLNNPKNGVEGDSYQDYRAFLEGNVGFMFTSIDALSEISSKFKDDWGIAPVPMGPKAKDYTALSQGTLAWGMPISNKDYEKSVICMEALSAPVNASTNDDLNVYYDEIKNNYFSKDEDFKILQLIWDATEFDVANGMTEYGELANPINDCTRSNTSTPLVAMQEVFDKYSGYVNEYLN